MDITTAATDYNAQELEKRLNKENLLTSFEPGTGPGKDFKFGADYQQAGEKVLTPGFKTQIQGAGSQSLRDATASQSGDYFGRPDISGRSADFVRIQAGAGDANPKDYFSQKNLELATQGKISTSAQSLFTPQTPMEPTRYSMGPLLSGTPGIVAATEAQAGLNEPVLANFVEGNAGVADPNNDWNSFYKNASERFGFGLNRPVMGGNFAN